MALYLTPYWLGEFRVSYELRAERKLSSSFAVNSATSFRSWSWQWWWQLGCRQSSFDCTQECQLWLLFFLFLLSSNRRHRLRLSTRCLWTPFRSFGNAIELCQRSRSPGANHWCNVQEKKQKLGYVAHKINLRNIRVLIYILVCIWFDDNSIHQLNWSWPSPANGRRMSPNNRCMQFKCRCSLQSNAIQTLSYSVCFVWFVVAPRSP